MAIPIIIMFLGLSLIRMYIYNFKNNGHNFGILGSS